MNTHLHAVNFPGDTRPIGRVWLPFGGIALGFLALIQMSVTTLAAQAACNAIPPAQCGNTGSRHWETNGLSLLQTPEGASLRCLVQKLEGHVNKQGLWLTSTAAPSSGAPFRVVARSVGRESCPPLPLTEMGQVEYKSERVRFCREDLQEEYTVSMDGIRQDFIVTRRPVGYGALRVNLAVERAQAEPLKDGAQLVLDVSGRKLAYDRLRVTDALGRELTARMDVVSPGHIAVAVDDANASYPVRIDPTFSDANWIDLGGFGTAVIGQVNALACDNSGNLFVSSTDSSGAQPSSIARWNGKTWSSIASGIEGGVFALLCDSTGNLYAGGGSMVSEWNGSTWSPLGSGIDGGVYALAFDKKGNLYAGGFFDTAGDVSATNIAKWDGTNWSALGSGVGYCLPDEPNAVFSLACDTNGNLYAGGTFATAGGVSATNVAKWNGRSWSALGHGLVDGTGYALACDANGNLYAGGSFGTVGGPIGIARWNGKTWSALGSGVDEVVLSLAVDTSGNLYAGGAFTTAGGVSANRIAKWNGGTWSALGSGMSGSDSVGYTDQGANTFGPTVNALALDSLGNLYAGGNFYMAGTNVAFYVAQAGLTATNPVITPTHGSLRVTIAPSGAVKSGAKWQVDNNGVFEASGATVTNLSVGSHTVSFKPVSGWKTPQNQTISIVDAATNDVNGAYLSATPPTVAITSPKSALTVATNLVTVAGIAADSVAVAAVFCESYSQAGTNPWVLASGTTSWSALVPLVAGTNHVRAYAVDSSGNASATNTSPAIVYQVLAPVQIGIVGEGEVQLAGPGVSRNLTTTTVLLLGLGQNYTLTAVPTSHSGFGFQGWSGSQTGTNPKLGFHSASNLLFTATFRDEQRPVDQIFYPKAKAIVADAMITVTGKASDNVGVTNVWLIVNGTNWAVMTLNQWTNWSAANVSLVPGANILQSFAADDAGNISLTNTVNCTYTRSDLAPLSITGMTVWPASPAFTRTFGAGTYSETMLPGSNPDQNFVGTYTYTKLTADTAIISGQRTSPPGNAYGSSNTAPGGQEAWVINFTTKTTATLTFTNSDGTVKTATVTFSPTANTAPDTVAGKTLRVISHQGGGATEVLGAATFADGGTSGNADAGTYTFQRYSPVGGLLVSSWTAPAEQAGQVGYMALTFSSSTAGTYYAERDDASGNETATDWGTFTLR